MAARLGLFSLLAASFMATATPTASGVEVDIFAAYSSSLVLIDENCTDRNARPLFDEFEVPPFDPKTAHLPRKKRQYSPSPPPDIVCHPVYAVDQVALSAALSVDNYPDGTPKEPKNEPKSDPWSEYRPDPPEGYEWQLDGLWGMHIVANGRAEVVSWPRSDPFNRIGMIDPDPFHDLILSDDNSFAIVSNGRDIEPKHFRNLWEGNSVIGAIDPDQHHLVQSSGPGAYKIIDLHTGTDAQDWQQESEPVGSRFDGPSGSKDSEGEYLRRKLLAWEAAAAATKFAADHPQAVQATMIAAIVVGGTWGAGAALAGRGATVLLNTSKFAFAAQLSTNRLAFPFILTLLDPINNAPRWTKSTADWAAQKAKEAESELAEYDAEQKEQTARTEQAAQTAINEKAQRDVDTPYEPTLPEDSRLERTGPGSYMVPAEHSEFKNA